MIMNSYKVGVLENSCAVHNGRQVVIVYLR